MKFLHDIVTVSTQLEEKDEEKKKKKKTHTVKRHAKGNHDQV